MVWGAVPQEGHRLLRPLSNNARKLLRDEQYPERSWESADLWGRGSDVSSTATGGAPSPRTALFGSSAMDRWTASEWMAAIVSLYCSGGTTPFTV